MENADDIDSEVKLKVKIALAIAVIKSKPLGCSLRQHILNLQEAAHKRDSQVNNLQISTGCFNLRNRIHVLQHKLFWGVLPLEFPKESCKVLVDAENAVPDSGSPQDIFEETEFHIKFIQAMIQLKSTINTCSSVKISTFHEIMRSMPCDNTSNRCYMYSDHNFLQKSHVPTLGFNDQRNTFDSQDDSGYVSFATSSSSIREGDVSSTMLKYLIYNSDANQVFLESIKIVLKHLETIVLNKDIICIETHLKNWKGSLLEDAVNMLVNIVNLFHQDETVNASHSLCMKFVKNIIYSIIEDSQNLKFADFEYQCMVVSELCENNFLCCDTIDILLEHVVLLSKVPNESFCVIETSENGNSLNLDTQFYIFHLLEILMNKYLKRNLDNMKRELMTNNKENTTDISEVWKLNFAARLNISANKSNSTLHKFLEWKKLLEDCTYQFCSKSPKLAFSCSCCLSLLMKAINFK